MSDDYLWDGSGQPDLDVQKLERMLGGLRHSRTFADAGLAGAGPQAAPWAWFLGRRPARVWYAIAAAIVLFAAFGGGLLWLRAGRPFVEVATLSGGPTIGSEPIGARGRLAVGQRLVTDASSRARIDVGLMGQVELEPGSRVVLAAARPTEQRLSLEAGTIHARIWAPPRLFQVEVPSAVAIDLGCAYTLSVDPAGFGLLHVTQGWVAFESGGRESFVPQGAQCATRPDSGPGPGPRPGPRAGPGTPYRDDASEPFRGALTLLDFDAQASPGVRTAALDTLLAEARARDALTLWHLLSRTDGEEQERIYDRLAELAPPLGSIARARVLAGDRMMLDLWWNELGLNDASFWRLWEGTWPPRAR